MFVGACQRYRSNTGTISHGCCKACSLCRLAEAVSFLRQTTAYGMDHASGLCQSPSELFILELCEVEGADEGFAVCL